MHILIILIDIFLCLDQFSHTFHWCTNDSKKDSRRGAKGTSIKPQDRQRERGTAARRSSAPLLVDRGSVCSRKFSGGVIMSRSLARSRSQPSAATFRADPRARARERALYRYRGETARGNETETCRRRITCFVITSSGILASVSASWWPSYASSWILRISYMVFERGHIVGNVRIDGSAYIIVAWSLIFLR